MALQSARRSRRVDDHGPPRPAGAAVRAVSAPARPKRRSGAPAPRRTQAERRAVAMQRMLGAAITLIGEKGYRGTTLAEIGQVAGYSRGLAHHYFGSKLELMRAVADELNERFARMVPPTEQRGLDALFSYVEVYFAQISGAGAGRMRTSLVLLFESLAAAPELRPVVAGLSAGSRAHISARISQGIADGSIRPDLDPAMEAMLIAGLLRNAIHEWVLDPAGIDIPATLAATLALLRRHLAVEPSA